MKYAIGTKVAATVLLASLAAGANATPIKDKDKGVKQFVSSVISGFQQPQSKNSGPNLGTLISGLIKEIKIDFKEEKVKIAKVSFEPSFEKPDIKKFEKIETKFAKISSVGGKDCEPHGVPEPAPLVLIGSALLALGVYRRKLAPAA